jgi:GT2 family glycosyltransferase
MSESTGQQKIALVIATWRRVELLQRCLASVELAARAVDSEIDLQVWVAINGADRESATFLRAYPSTSQLDFQIRELPEAITPAAARNRLIAQITQRDGDAAQAVDWLYFLDDDAFIDQGFFTQFLDSLRRFPDVDVVGGPNLTPAGSTRFQRACGVALASRFGSAEASARYYADATHRTRCGDEALILCNLFVRASVLRAHRFPESFVCNEENWLLQTLEADGCHLAYDPALYVWHERRPRFAQFLAQIHRYGRGRGQNARLRPCTTKPSHLLPSLCLLLTLLALLVTPWLPVIGDVWLVLLICYLAIWAVASARLARRNHEELTTSLCGSLLFPVIHVAYGAGVLRGLMVGND